MTETEVLGVLYQAFLLALRLALPFLLVSMVVGVVISIFQAATQINEQTLTFVPYYLWNNRGIGEMTVWVGAVN